MYRAERGKRRRNKLMILAALALLAASGAGGLWLHRRHSASLAPANSSPVPKTVSQAVSFPVYYPDPKKLPAGYILNENSFARPVKNGVTYSVNYDNGKRIVFSVQAKPADSELQSFNGNYIPLRIDYQTPVGQAEIGAYNNHGKVETLVSLPTKANSWIIITAPYDINQNQLKQVLSSMKR